MSVPTDLQSQIRWLEALQPYDRALLPLDVRDLLLSILRKLERLEKERGIPL